MMALETTARTCWIVFHYRNQTLLATEWCGEIPQENTWIHFHDLSSVGRLYVDAVQPSGEIRKDGLSRVDVYLLEEVSQPSDMYSSWRKFFAWVALSVLASLVFWAIVYAIVHYIP